MHTSAWGSPSFGGTSTESRVFSTANSTLSLPGLGKGTLETTYAMTSHNGLLKLLKSCEHLMQWQTIKWETSIVQVTFMIKVERE